MMGRIDTIGNVTLRINGGDHNPPHFHVHGPDFEALVTIDNPTIIAGDMPARTRKEVFAWAAANRAKLVAHWNNWNSNIAIKE
jgi:hypothetical protein